MLYNSGTSAYDVEYSCAVDEVNKKVTVDFGSKTKSDLTNVKFKFVISDYATFSINDVGMTSSYSLKDWIDYGDITIKVRSQDSIYYSIETTTEYQFTVSCIDCGNWSKETNGICNRNMKKILALSILI